MNGVMKIELECDQADFDVIQFAITQRQQFNRPKSLPDGEGNPVGRIVAEICRGWLEMLNVED